MNSGNATDRNIGSPDFLQSDNNGHPRCLLCHHGCAPAEGCSGVCGSRKVLDGVITDAGYGLVTAAAADPVEKKPLYHFRPGESIFSLGFTGCNFHCPFCQNWGIADPSRIQGDFLSPRESIDRVVESGCRLLAFTYSEPAIHFEYLCDCASLARSRGIKTVLVTNGGILHQPAEILLELIDGVNVDVKSWDPEYYRRILGGNLDTVRRFVEIAFEKSWVEVTTLVVPGDNDKDGTVDGISEWLAGLSRDIPLHLSAYHPAREYSRDATTRETMERLGEIARHRLRFVYLGNLGLANNTICPGCGSIVIQRTWYDTVNRLVSGKCPECETRIPGVFN